MNENPTYTVEFWSGNICVQTWVRGTRERAPENARRKLNRKYPPGSGSAWRLIQGEITNVCVYPPPALPGP